MICSADKCCGRANVSSAISIRCAVGNTPRLRQQRGNLIACHSSIPYKSATWAVYPRRGVDIKAAENYPISAVSASTAAPARRRSLRPGGPHATFARLFAVGTVVHARRGCRHARRRDTDLSLVSARCRLTADVNAWVLAVQLARSEAAKRGRPVMVCRTIDTRRCATGTAGTPLAGWMVFVNLDDEYPPQRSPAEPLL